MTDRERRDVLLGIATWEPNAPSVELLPADRSELREQAAMQVAEALGIPAETALNRMEALRMAS